MGAEEEKPIKKILTYDFYNDSDITDFASLINNIMI